MISILAAALMAVAAPPPAVAAAPRPSADASIEEQRRWFTEDAVAPTVKPPNYDVTIVEYMDYQCPYCRATHGPLKQLLARDKKVRVIFRDWPIFGDASVKAALAAIASKYQGKYFAFHDALMETPLPLDDSKIRAAARKAGVDWERLQDDKIAHSEEIEDLFQRNSEQADMMGLDGTPGFIIGNVQSFGGMTLKQLETSVANARKASRQSESKSATAKAK
ncbi:MAG TPA: DsbA family protein [Sphingomicrobium sp.]|nr:DsbA family protein [Sphingomicrobium sp.]